MVCIPRVHFLEQASAAALSPTLGSHVYAFVPHYSGAASADPHLAFKFPDRPASHAPTERRSSRVLRSSCSGKAARVMQAGSGGLLGDAALLLCTQETGLSGFCLVTSITQSCVYSSDEERKETTAATSTGAFKTVKRSRNLWFFFSKCWKIKT